MVGYRCEECGKTYTTVYSLARHQRVHTGERPYECQICGQRYQRVDSLQHHEALHRKRAASSIINENPILVKKPRTEAEEIAAASEAFLRDEEEEREIQACISHFERAISSGKEDQDLSASTELMHGAGMDENQPSFPINVEEALEGCAVGHRYTFPPSTDPLQTLQDVVHQLPAILARNLRAREGIKWFLSIETIFRQGKDPNIITEPCIVFRTPSFHAYTQDTLVRDLKDAFQYLQTAIDEFQHQGSGWILQSIKQLEVGVARITPLHGSSYFTLPEPIRAKKAVLNIHSNDEKCFMWAILASLHPQEENANRVVHYQRYQHELNLNGLQFPFPLKDVSKFEKQNQSISVNVIGWEKGDFHPLYVTKEEREHHVDLLLLHHNSKSHYCLIRDISRLLSSQLSNHNGAKYICRYCLHGFKEERTLKEHVPLCSVHGLQRVKMPKEEHATLQFTKIQNQLKCPFVLYADFECLLLPTSTCENNPSTSFAHDVQRHEACGYSFYLVSQGEQISQRPTVYRGPNAPLHFLDSLVNLSRELYQSLKHPKPVEITEQEHFNFINADTCHICERPLNDDKVLDHCHLTGRYRGAAHNACNLNYRINPKTLKIPVFFHNLRGYDAHLLLQAYLPRHGKISVIANNMERYVSFDIGRLRFLDSAQFMPASLDSLSKNLSSEQFKHTLKWIPQDRAPLLLRKGVYPYEYMDSWERFEETTLPAKAKFFSSLTQSTITEEEYAHAQAVWTAFDLRNLGEYHDLYLQTDVLLLADVFENFRLSGLEHYKLDPAHSYTSPGLAWQAALLKTDIELDLFTDQEMYLFIERGIRGGVSMITHRYAQANNPYTPGYNPDLPHNYLIYLDANNLYGWAMSQSLPTGDFSWLSEDEIDGFRIKDIDEDDYIGYILEVDLDYPESLHEHHRDYPLAPEPLNITEDLLSPYQKNLREKLRLKSPSSNIKLTPNLYNKRNYVVHYRTLKCYLRHGLQLKKIHKILSFHQEPWLRPYISYNTTMRAQAQNNFEKDLYKLMNNSVFGKTMENLRAHKNIEIVHNGRRFKKLAAKPTFPHFRIFTPSLVAVDLQKTSLLLNRPVYLGFTILDLSKVLMYNFHYDVIKNHYPGNTSRLLFTDTDSLCYSVETDDLYQDLAPMKNLFDFSDYPPSHALYSTENKKVIGKMKDELCGKPMEEFIGLRPKMYSFKYEGKEKKTAKGVKKVIVKDVVTHDDYKQCLFQAALKRNEMFNITSYSHQISTVKQSKTSLSSYDDKRYILEDGVHSLPYGHHQAK